MRNESIGWRREHYLLVRPVERWEAAHDERRETVGSDSELQSDHREPGVAIAGEAIHPGGIGHSKEITRDILWRQRIRFRYTKTLSFVVECNHAKGVAQDPDQRLPQNWISAVFTHFFGPRPDHRLRIDRQQQSRPRARNLDLDCAPVM
jgi:hypothetical protein